MVHTVSFEQAEIGYRLSDRLYDVQRDLDKVVNLGCGRGYVSKHITPDRIKHLTLTDSCAKFVEQAEVDEQFNPDNVVRMTLCEDEDDWPFAKNSVTCFISSLALHWVNDLQKCFNNIQRSLKPDGFFLCSVFGGETLYQLRGSLQMAELEREGGIGAHVSPLMRVEDLSGLMNRAGFTMMTLDADEITVRYPSIFEVMHDLRGMAENNANLNRKLHINRDTLLAAAAIYQEMYGEKAHGDLPGGVPLTFQVYYAIGWKPDPSQPKPAPRGSGDVSFKDLPNIERILKKRGKLE
jgi:NADH dehydrogenase [ubiquinone] 1 alpha subcomplex assembly factor 5